MTESMFTVTVRDDGGLEIRSKLGEGRVTILPSGSIEVRSKSFKLLEAMKVDGSDDEFYIPFEGSNGE